MESVTETRDEVRLYKFWLLSKDSAIHSRTTIREADGPRALGLQHCLFLPFHSCLFIQHRWKNLSYGGSPSPLMPARPEPPCPSGTGEGKTHWSPGLGTRSPLCLFSQSFSVFEDTDRLIRCSDILATWFCLSAPAKLVTSSLHTNTFKTCQNKKKTEA